MGLCPSRGRGALIVLTALTWPLFGAGVSTLSTVSTVGFLFGCGQGKRVNQVNRALLAAPDMAWGTFGAEVCMLDQQIKNRVQLLHLGELPAVPLMEIAPGDPEGGALTGLFVLTM